VSSASVLMLIPERWRNGLRRRAAGLVLALTLELLLALLLLTLRPETFSGEEDRSIPVFTMDASDDAAPAAEPEAPAEAPAAAAPSAAEAPTPPAPVPREAEAEAPPTDAPPVAAPTPPPVPPYIPMTRESMASADLARREAPRAPAGPPAPARRTAMGPPDTGRASGYGDTERVGTAPNGEPLYAAAWYREPYPEELRGYLSTAQGPGWGLIACRTAPDYRVEDCVSLGESPDGSNIARAVLAAAWQFKVRPPRVGGQPKIGEWVRIRIDYGIEGRRR
jgi:periplasmic protein TonB